jgi:hypothetical protein
MSKFFLLLLLSIASSPAQTAPVILPGNELKTVRLKAIQVKGSRIPPTSVLHLAGITAGQTLDEPKLRAALQHANASGLFLNIDYDYVSDPGTDDVTLVLDVKDQLPLVPAMIKIPGVTPEAAWKYLEGVDPLFTRDLPYSIDGVNLYARYLTKYMQTLARTEVITGTVTNTGQKITGVVFAPVKSRTLKH